MWKWIVKIAMLIGQSEWARKKAKEAINNVRKKAEKKADQMAATAQIAVPPLLPAASKSIIIRTKSECFKPGQFVYVEQGTYQITKLLMASAREVVYEAVAV